MKLYNTLTRRKEDFIPLEEGKVKMYVCGPTVYDYIHIGNARPYVIFDTIRRYFEYKGYEVTYVQNFTDVDDKIIKRARKEKVDSSVIAERYIDEAKKDEKSLNVKPASHNPKVTEEIPEIIAMVETLIEKGFAYEVNGSVFYETRKFADYGKLSRKNPEELEAGARIEIDEEKRSPMDFVLWKPAKPGEPKWESPWGEGRPGWHIECSAMAKKYLGDTFDIHAGGGDIMFPHHENEIAQSEAANGKPFARYWLHNGLINIDNQKMSKSLGNFFTVREIANRFPYQVIRFFILNGHYRSPINFSNELIASSQSGLDRIKNCLSHLNYLLNAVTMTEISKEEKILSEKADEFVKYFEESMEDDFNTSNAVTAIYEIVRLANTEITEGSSKEIINLFIDRISTLCGILGIALDDEAVVESSEIESLIQERKLAKEQKNWLEADRIRNKLSDMGVTLRDTPLGTEWVLKGKS